MSSKSTLAEFIEKKETLSQAKFGSYLIIPLKFDANQLNLPRMEIIAKRFPITTMDLNETVKDLLNDGTSTNVGICYQIERGILIRELFGAENICTFSVLNEDTSFSFDFVDSYLYCFHTQVAFLCLGIRYSSMDALNMICNPGYADSCADYRFINTDGLTVQFSLNEMLTVLCNTLGLRRFFDSGASMLVENYTYTLAIVPERFHEMETMRQITFNLHLMTPLDNAVEDESEADVSYVFAVKNHAMDTYRWGCCVSSQTISYVVADSEMDLDREMLTQAEDGLPLVLIALYEKYTCLRFTQLITSINTKKINQLASLKRMMLDFRAYGTVQAANISRWHNVKRIYQGIIESNEIPTAMEDINCKLNILVEHQREIETARNDAVAWVLTLFGIVSILASILSIVQILAGGNPLEWFATIMSTLLIALLVAVVVIFRRKRD